MFKADKFSLMLEDVAGLNSYGPSFGPQTCNIPKQNPFHMRLKLYECFLVVRVKEMRLNLVAILIKAAIPEVYLIVFQDCKIWSTIASPILQSKKEASSG